MSEPRIIRPAEGALGEGVSCVDLNLQDLRALGEQVVQEVREKIAALEAEKSALEEKLRARRKEVEGELAELARARQGELERDLAEERKKFLEAGRKEGNEEGHRAGFEKGYGEGRESGCREGQASETQRLREDARTLLPTIRTLAEALSRGRDELLQGARRELIHLAVEIARRIVKREVRDPKGMVLENIRHAVEMVYLGTGIVIEIHPEDRDLTERYLPELLEGIAGLEHFELRTSRDVARGGCRVTCGTGQVDLAIETQLDVIEKALLGEEMEGELAKPSRPSGRSPGATASRGQNAREPSAKEVTR